MNTKIINCVANCLRCKNNTSETYNDIKCKHIVFFDHIRFKCYNYIREDRKGK